MFGTCSNHRPSHVNHYMLRCSHLYCVSCLLLLCFISMHIFKKQTCFFVLFPSLSPSLLGPKEGSWSWWTQRSSKSKALEGRPRVWKWRWDEPNTFGGIQCPWPLRGFVWGWLVGSTESGLSEFGHVGFFLLGVWCFLKLPIFTIGWEVGSWWRWISSEFHNCWMCLLISTLAVVVIVGFLPGDSDLLESKESSLSLPRPRGETMPLVRDFFRTGTNCPWIRPYQGLVSWGRYP